ncbi:MAG TPA: glutaminyl-peptide cyclotransferase [Pyrinomonadaceae bacterium]|jgi:glutamine cyclotransferase
MRNTLGLILLTTTLGVAGCDGGAQANGAAGGVGSATPKATLGATGDSGRQVPVYGYEVVNTFPHDPEAFTQGLVFRDGALVESTGLERHSTLRRVELQTGKVLQKVDVPPYFFAEGLTLLNGKLYQLTWKGEKGFVYDPESFKKTGEFAYEGEGWGLAQDGESLILSDGSDQLRFIDPNTFKVRRTINVSDRGLPVEQLNELEYVRGEVYANVWHQNRVARIDPRSGRVVGWIDLTGLLRPGETTDPEAVLNGIAYDERGDRLFVTGKLWPKLFEVRLKQK